MLTPWLRLIHAAITLAATYQVIVVALVPVVAVVECHVSLLLTLQFRIVFNQLHDGPPVLDRLLQLLLSLVEALHHHRQVPN